MIISPSIIMIMPSIFSSIYHLMTRPGSLASPTSWSSRAGCTELGDTTTRSSTFSSSSSSSSFSSASPSSSSSLSSKIVLNELARRADLAPACDVIQPSLYSHFCGPFCPWFAPLGGWEAAYAKNPEDHYVYGYRSDDEEEGSDEYHFSDEFDSGDEIDFPYDYHDAVGYGDFEGYGAIMWRIW